MRSIYILLIIVTFICIYVISLPTVKEHFLIGTLKEHLTLIDPTFSNLDIREANNSYTEDKSIIYICLKNEKGELYPMNTLMYVILHEVAHLINKDDFGHTPAFNDIFHKLLCKASKAGIYDSSKSHGDWYCGIDIRNITPPTCDLDSL